MTKYALWSIPFLIIPVSYIFFRYVPLRKIRYCCYCIVLVAAFFLNLFRVSFHNEIFDTVLVMAVNLIFAEFFWNLLRLKSPKMFRILLAVALLAYCVEFRQWLIAGPNHGWELWKPYTASTFRRGEVHYSIKERDLFDVFRPARLMVLSRQAAVPFLEKELSTYRTPQGFRYTDFTYKWSITPQGVRLDLATAGYTLWTMGEGF